MSDKNIENTIARTIMTDHIYKLNIEASLDQVVKLMNDEHISGVFLEDEKSNQYYIITHTDIVAWLNSAVGKPLHIEQVNVSDIMNGPVEMIDENMPIDKVIHHLRDKDIKRTLVARDSKPIGVISFSDILQWNYNYFKVGIPQAFLVIENKSGILIGKHIFEENIDEPVNQELMDLFGGALKSISHITNEVLGKQTQMKNLIGENHAVLFEVFFEITGILICDQHSIELHQKLHTAVRLFYKKHEKRIQSKGLKTEWNVSDIIGAFD
ncbi:MAG: CBS domain-containing protein [Candidatus Lokiarchaeota archaeon]|nr:CBS domain-containing protein [Candidatus Lokiarchaeota archaeon]